MGMAAQKRAEELFAVAMWQRRWRSSFFCISGGSAHVGIRCREAKGLLRAWSINLQGRISPGRTSGKNNHPKIIDKP
jgi:hypothetical protein